MRHRHQKDDWLLCFGRTKAELGGREKGRGEERPNSRANGGMDERGNARTNERVNERTHERTDANERASERTRKKWVGQRDEGERGGEESEERPGEER